MKPLPIGESDFEELIKNGSYYVDKTGSIEELLTNKSKVILFPRPRRFGKSLFMSMLDNFFDIDKRDKNKDLFKDLYISKSPYYSELNTYPTIFLNFKDLKSDNFNSSLYIFKARIGELYRNKSYVFNILDEEEKEKYKRIQGEKGTENDYKDSLKLLSIWLERFHNKKVIILIDEYDAAINEGYICGYYKEIVNLLQPVLSSALKDNTSLKMGILTGVLRIGGASLFSSFNNLDVYDVMSEHYNEYFGFTESETKELLESYDLKLTPEVKRYYDGYNFSGLHIYNPWSILNYANRRVLEPYWMSTGSNKLIKELLISIDNKEKLESLIKGESIIFDYDKSVTYESFTDAKDLNNLLNLLLVSGYVTYDKSEEEIITGRNITYFKVPNNEVLSDFINIMNSIAFDNKLSSIDGYDNFIKALANGNKEYIENFINKILLSTSYYDLKKENDYQLFTLLLFSAFLNNKLFKVVSNRESGNGSPDIMITKYDKTLGIVIEIKKTDKESDMETKSVEGLKQIKDKNYYKELELDNIENIQEYTIVYSGKKCIVR